MLNTEAAREILGQMTMLSLVTDKSYSLNIQDMGFFEINVQKIEEGADVIWTDLEGEQHQVNRDNIEWVLYEADITTEADYLPAEKDDQTYQGVA